MKTKQCNKCKQTKKVNKFSKNKSLSSGYIPICKHCIKSYRDNRDIEQSDVCFDSLLNVKWACN